MKRTGKISWYAAVLLAIIAAAGATIVVNLSIGMSRRHPRNVLLITLDTVRPDRTGCYGWSAAKTPVLDGIAAGGVLFENAATPSPVTLPSHATILTGRLPVEHGARDNALYVVPEKERSLPEIFRDNGWETAAFLAAYVLDSRYGLAQGFDLYDDTMDTLEDSPLLPAQRKADSVTDAAISWLQNRSDKPFFLWVHYYDPHQPLDPPDPFPKTYDGEIAFMDREIGRLMDEMKNKDVLADTVIVAVSDHGEGLGDHGEYTHGRFLYESTVRAFLTINGLTGMKPGARVTELAGTEDIFATLVREFGFDEDIPFCSDDLHETAEGGISVKDRYVYLETEMPSNAYGWPSVTGIRSKDHKYIRNGSGQELYDLSSDPGEEKNLASAKRGKLEQLRAALDSIIAGAASSDADKVTIDPETRRRLESLGYAGRSSPADNDVSRDPGGQTEFLRMTSDVELLMEQGRYEESSAILSSAAERFPDNVFVSYLLGECARRLKRQEEAVAHFRNAVKISPNHLNAWKKMGMALQDAGMFREAVGAYFRVLEINPNDRIHLSLGTCLVRLGDRKEGLKMFQRSIDLDPSDPDGYVNTGICLYEMNIIPAATAMFRKAIELSPREPEALYQLGRTLNQSGRYDEALAVLEQASGEDPERGAIMFEKGLVLTAMSRKKEALAAFRAASERLPEDPACLANLAVAAVLCGEKQECIDALRRAIAVDSNVRDFAASNPYFDPVRGDPAFEQAIRRSPE